MLRGFVYWMTGDTWHGKLALRVYAVIFVGSLWALSFQIVRWMLG